MFTIQDAYCTECQSTNISGCKQFPSVAANLATFARFCKHWRHWRTNHLLISGASIDLSDLREDPVVMFQHRYYLPLVVIFWFLLPTLIPYLLWNESILHAFLTCVCFRYVFALHSTWTVNSIAHLYGHRPYDKRVQPRENEFVIYASFGEGKDVIETFEHTFLIVSFNRLPQLSPRLPLRLRDKRVWLVADIQSDHSADWLLCVHWPGGAEKDGAQAHCAETSGADGRRSAEPANRPSSPADWYTAGHCGHLAAF